MLTLTFKMVNAHIHVPLCYIPLFVSHYTMLHTTLCITLIFTHIALCYISLCVSPYTSPLLPCVTYHPVYHPRLLTCCSVLHITLCFTLDFPLLPSVTYHPVNHCKLLTCCPVLHITLCITLDFPLVALCYISPCISP